MSETLREVFISYAKEDESFAHRLMNVLESHRVPYWADRNIKPGTKWLDEIESALRRASVFVLIISPSFQSSEFALFEAGVAVGRAQESGAAVVPILLPGAVLPPVLRGYQAIHSDTTNVEDIAARLGAAIRGQKKTEVPLMGIREVSVFVSAGADLTAERECAARVVDELNVKVGKARRVLLRRFTWEAESTLRIEKYPQAAINDAVREVDVFLLILGMRFGAEARVGAGVEEEFRIFFDKWKLTGRPTILCYMKTAPMKVQSLEQLEQIRRVLEFKEQLKSSGIVYEFDSLDELEHMLHVHLTNVIASLAGVV